MTKEELDNEIEFAHKNRLRNELIRPFGVMQKIIVEATNTYTNISLFMNDYISLCNDYLIDKDTFNSAMNDLYLLALLHTGYEGKELEQWLKNLIV